MFYIRFLIGGLIIAFVPVVASKFNGKVAGYLILIPVIMYLSFIALYLSNGQKTTTQAAQSYLLGLPAVAVSAALILILLKMNLNIYLTIFVGVVGWLLTIFVVNKLFS